MKTFDFDDVQAAYERIQSFVPMTPLEESFYLSQDEKKVFFKLESLQKMKSFKIRGALNKLMSLTEAEKNRGIVAISSGNYGSSVSYGASLLGIPNVTVIVPETTPVSKVEKIERFGAKALLMGTYYDESYALGIAYVREQQLTFMDYDAPVYAGQGTIAIELFKQNPSIDTIILPIGGGGLMTGVAVAARALQPRVQIIGVQTEANPAFIKSYEEGVRYETFVPETSYCDAILGGIDALSFEMAKDYVDEFVTVSEAEIARAVSFLAKKEKLIAEPASCTTIAVLKEHPDKVKGKNIALILTGANIDGTVLTEILNKY